MPGCVLRVAGSKDGDDLAIEDCLTSFSFEPLVVFRRGKPRAGISHRLSDQSGFNVSVSDSGCSPEQQVRDARAFLRHHQAELKRLADFPGFESMSLDFSLLLSASKDSLGIHLDLDLIGLCADLNIEIVCSTYRSSSS